MIDGAAIPKPMVSPWLIAVVVSLATFMEVLDTTITNVSIRHIAGSLAAGQEESTWVLTSYLVANGIILPLSGWLANVMGRKRFFLMCIAGFTAASFMCGASTSLPMLIIFRLIQGAAGGGLQPTQQAIILDYFPANKRGQVFAITGITMIVAPVLGPTLGGFITDNYNWRWIFYINIPIGIIAFLLVWRLVQDPPHAKAQGAGSIDYIGLGLVGLGLGAMQIVLDKGQQEDWFDSNFICTVTVISLLCLGSAIFWLLKRKDPIVDLSLLRDRSFAISSIMIFLTGFVLYGGSTLLPQLLQTQFGYNSTLAGMVLSPGGLALIFLMPLVGKLVTKVQARYLVTFGLLLSAWGMFHTAMMTPQTGYNAFVWMRVTQVLGLPFLFIPNSTLAFQNVPKEKSNKASALFALFRNVGGSIGIAVAITYTTRRAQLHQAVLVEHLTPANPAYREALQHATQLGGSETIGLTAIYHSLLAQSNIMAYVDTFRFMGIMMLLAAGIAILLMPRNKPHIPTAEEAAVH